jgi:hypothetical protein
VACVAFDAYAVFERDASRDAGCDVSGRVQNDVVGSEENRGFAVGEQADEAHEGCDALSWRAAENGVGRAVRGDQTIQEHDDAIGERPRLGAVVDDDERGAAAGGSQG